MKTGTAQRIVQLLRRAAQLQCLACGRGKLAAGLFELPKRCGRCGYYFERETGYFLPHVVIGYVPTVGVALGCWQFLERVLKIRADAAILPIAIGAAVLFAIWFVRYAKALWIAFDLLFHPPTAEDFQPRNP